MKHLIAALTLGAAMAQPQASYACAQLSANVWMCDRGTPWETATWDVIGDGSTRYLGEVIFNFTEEWPGHEITDPAATLEEQYTTYAEWIAGDGGPAPDVRQIDQIKTPQGETFRHLQYDEIEGARTMSAVMLSQVGDARIMLYLDTADSMPLAEMDKLSYDVAMMLRDTCADEVSCAEGYTPPETGTD